MMASALLLSFASTPSHALTFDFSFTNVTGGVSVWRFRTMALSQKAKAHLRLLCQGIALRRLGPRLFELLIGALFQKPDSCESSENNNCHQLLARRCEPRLDKRRADCVLE
jgi:hypothetical protein